MLNIKQIMQYCNCNEDLAKKIEATMDQCVSVEHINYTPINVDQLKMELLQ